MQINQLPEILSGSISNDDWLLLQTNPGAVTHKTKLSELLLDRAGGGMTARFIDGSSSFTPASNDRVIASIAANYSLTIPTDPTPGYFFSVLPVNVSVLKRLRLGTANFRFQGLDSSVYFDVPFLETGFLYVDETIGWIATSQSNITIVKSDPLWGQVRVLLPFEGSEGGLSFPEVKAGRPVTRTGSVITSLSQSKWGKGSAYFNGSGGYLRIAPTVDFPATDYNLPGDFTIEVWLYLVALGSAGTMWVFRDTGDLSPGGFEFFLTSNAVFANASSSGPGWGGLYSVPLNAWGHHALTRSGNTYRYFYNGGLVSSNTFSDSPANTAGGIIFGRYWNGSYHLNGYLNDFRMTVGTARYTSPFDPPTEAFPRG